MNTRGELASCGPTPPPLEAERQPGDSQSWKARGNLGPRDGILHQTVRRLPVTNEVFLDPGRLTSTRRVTARISSPEETHGPPEMVLSRCTQEMQGLGQGGDKMHHPAGRVRSPSTWSPELLGPEKGTKRRHSSLCLCGVPENLNLSSLGLGSAHNPGLALDSSPAEQPGA